MKFLKANAKLFALALSLLLLLCLEQSMLGYHFGSRVIREALVSLGLMALMVSFTRKKFWLIVPIAFWLLAFCYGLVGLTYGMVDRNAIAAFMFTDVSETWDFIQTIPLFVIGYYVAFVGLTGLIIAGVRSVEFDALRNWKFRVVALTLVLALSSSSVVRYWLQGKAFNPHEVRVAEFLIPMSYYSAYQSFKSNVTSRSLFNRTPHWTLEKRETLTPSCDVCVVVMGESVRRDFMQAYGAPWANTPWMATAPGTLFTNFNSASSATAPSLSVELYAFDKEGNAPWADNLITLAKKAGYYTEWISNQARRGTNDSPISVVASYADKQTFLKDSPPTSVDGHTDEALLAPIESALARPGKLFIFVHLWGSHPLACSRTKGKYDEFFESKELSCYVQSLKNTDALLASIDATLKADPQHRSWGLLYTADHGLGFSKSVKGWELVHMDKERQVYEVPLFITGSTATQREVFAAERSGRYFTHMVADWLGFKAWTNEASQALTCRYLKDEFCQGQSDVRPFYRAYQPKRDFPSHSLEEFQAERKLESNS